MVVEDNPIDRKLMTAVLQIGGHYVLERPSAENAYEAIIAEPPDLILLDLKPGMDVLAVTAAGEQFAKEDTSTAGCDDYIAKPIATRTLADQVAEIVKHSRSEP